VTERIRKKTETDVKETARPDAGFEKGVVVIPRSEHPISRRNISREALKVLYRLHRLGYKAYLVGGGVRDLFLGRKPKDFDVATDARPNRLRKIFRNCRVIGRRFRLVHVVFGDKKPIEVSTFRKSADFALKQENGLIVRDNTYGTPEEDARRRDLTINGLFYDIATFSVLDYVGGVQDLKNRIIRTITEPNQSFREDPVRMIRALRHSARLDFTIEEKTYEAILVNRELITYTSPARLTEEIYRDLSGGASERFFKLLLQTGLMEYIFPDLARLLKAEEDHGLWKRLRALDEFTAAGREFPQTVLATVLLAPVLLPPELESSRRAGAEGIDVGKLVYQRLRSMKAHFRLSLQGSNRVVQILMARRRLAASPAGRPLPRSLLGKSYTLEALLYHEILERAEGRPTSYLQRYISQAQALQRERRKCFQKRTAPDGKQGTRRDTTSRARRGRSRRSRKKQRTRRK